MASGDFSQFLTALGAFESGIDTTQPQSMSYLQFLRVFDSQYGNVNPSTVNINNPADLANLQYHVFNTLGFMGKYQFGEPLLIDLGYYVPAPSGYYGTTATNEWQGTWTGKNGVFSKADFMSNVQELAIREAFAMNMGIIKDYLAQAGKTLEDFLGKEFTYSRLGETHIAKVTISGILASAHLQGPGGVAQLLLHNVASSDEYGTNILFYMDKYANFNTPFGTSGDDLLVGSSFGETFDGGAGHNTYQTGGGNDKIVITNNAGGSDVIQDFDVANAVISLSNFSGLTSHDLSITNSNGHALITFPNGQTISIMNVAASAITDKQFVYGPYKVTWDANTHQVLNNFNPKYDVIDLNYAFASNNIKLYEVNGSTILEVIGNNQTLTLQGITLSQLSEANFIKAPVDFATVQFGIGADHTPSTTPPVDTTHSGTTTDTGSAGSGSSSSGNTVQGTAGNDVFAYTWNWGSHAIINNFNVGADKIDLKNFWTSYDQFSVHNDAQGNAVIDLTNLNNQTITLQGVSASALTSTNFVGVSGVFSNSNTPSSSGSTTPPPITPEPPINSGNTGSSGSDSSNHSYAYTWNWGSHSVVQSFDVTKDVIDLKSFWTNYDQISIHNDAQGNAVIDLTGINNQTITLQGISSSLLTAKNILGVTGTFSHALTSSSGTSVDASSGSSNTSGGTGGTQVGGTSSLTVVNHNMNDATLVGQDNAKDVFNFTWNWGSNKSITNFNATQDVVDLKQFWTTPDHVTVHNDIHGNAVIDLTALNNQTITLLGVSADHVHLGDNVVL